MAPALERLLNHLGQLPEPAAEPVLIVVSGLPGTGKSYLSQKLAERIPLAILESDDLRKTLFPTPAYSQRESYYLFRTIHRLIELLLKKGISVLLDATNLSETNREYLYSISERAGAKLIIVRTTAPENVIRERLAARETRAGEKSDAGWEVYLKLKTEVEPIKRKHYTVNSTLDITPVVEKIVNEVNLRRK